MFSIPYTILFYCVLYVSPTKSREHGRQSDALMDAVARRLVGLADGYCLPGRRGHLLPVSGWGLEGASVDAAPGALGTAPNLQICNVVATSCQSNATIHHCNIAPPTTLNSISWLPLALVTAPFTPPPFVWNNSVALSTTAAAA